MSDMTAQIMQILREEYTRLDDEGPVEIDPAHIAAATMNRLDPYGAAPPLIGWAATMELRQLARPLCRKASSVDEPLDAPQGALFDGQLQRRYPALRGGRETYVLREHLSLAERRENSARLMREGESKIRHARALDAETDEMESRGDFDLSA